MDRPSLRRPLALLLVALALACGGEGTDVAGLPRNQWTFLAIDGATCSDGSPTGVEVNVGGPDLLIFLDGGGACLDYFSCFETDLASRGPYGEAELGAHVTKRVPGTPMDRTAPGNAFKDFTYVFVPYCTGDVHVGDHVAHYPDLKGDTHEYRHVGRANLEKALARLAALLPAPPKLVVSGASAGGFGAIVDYDRVRSTWPTARGYLVDDSGPPLEGRDVSTVVRAAWVASWRADRAMAPLCTECVEDWSKLFPAVAAKWPDDRLALMSSLRDEVIRSFLLLSPGDFEAAVRRLATEVVQPLPHTATFLVPGETHTFLGAPATFTAGGITAEAWLGQMVEDDPAWTSVGP